jgi:hypothetical protein
MTRQKKMGIVARIVAFAGAASGGCCVLSVVLWLMPRSTGISRESYDRVKLGMTQEEVRGVIGRPSGSYLTGGKETTRDLRESEGRLPEPFAPPTIWCGNAADLVVYFGADGRLVRKELYLDPP